jgi:hypothetical protein|tara:strand:+ start:234 stop:689 length:456 start_codon:yes stop_codon:yes gene_type:complete
MDIRKGLGMARSYAEALVSRGVTNKKIDEPIKRLRVLSCFGNMHDGGSLPACEHLKNSTTNGKYYCGGCGCGDRKATWLNGKEKEYSKLDYPKLSCPLEMPGFGNYKISDPEDGISPITRRYYIENMNDSDIEQVSITSPEPPKKENTEEL